MRLAAAFGFLALNFYVYHFLATQPVIPERRSFQDFPLQIGDWGCAEPQRMAPAVERNLGVTDYLLCDFVRRDPLAFVNVYLGYHATQIREEGGGAGENSIHPPAHCLPGSGWEVISSQDVLLDTPGLPQSPAPVKRLVIAKGEDRSVVYYWYQSRGRVISKDWEKIVFMGLDRALRGRTDGSLIRFTIPIQHNDEKAADATFQDLAPRILAHVPDYIPR
jgi:EpsI family protein